MLVILNVCHYNYQKEQSGFTFSKEWVGGREYKYRKKGKYCENEMIDSCF
jgi:hypothetical protein